MFKINDRINGIFVVTDIRIRKTQGGVGFTTAVLHTGSEHMKCVVWSDNALSEPSDNGSFVYVDGIVGEYRDEKQITIDTVYRVDPNTTPGCWCVVPTAPIDIEACYTEVYDTAQNLQDPALRSICCYALEYYQNSFSLIPAAKFIHHAFIGGLLMHVLSMLRIAKSVCQIYTFFPGREDSINYDLLCAGVILHDIGKLFEFRCYECGLVAEYTADGRQFGHSVLGAQIIDGIAGMLQVCSDSVNQLKHLLLSHHGTREHGAAAEPMTLEALLLSQIDNFDCKTEAAIKALDLVEPGEYTEKLFAFEGRQLFKPQYRTQKA